MPREIGENQGVFFSEKSLVNQGDSAEIFRKRRTEKYSLDLAAERLLDRTSVIWKLFQEIWP